MATGILNLHVSVGLLLFAATVAFFGVKYLRAPQRGRFGRRGWAGLAMVLVLELLLFLRTPWVTTFFTPLVWTAYLLLIDSLVESLEGESLLSRSPRGFFSLAFWSVPLWLIFEAYNLRLENWTYVGLPQNPLVRGIGYVWSFATIWPAIFETAAFVRALGFFSPNGAPRPPLAGSTRLAIFICGLAFVTLPVLLPAQIGAYFFGAVWVGFILLLDPVNYGWKGFSFLREFEAGESSTLISFLVSGWICGILWEFWNYWAAAKWIYIFPIGQAWKVFEMPLAGYLGFLPFAVECKVMYEFLRTVRRRFVEGRRWSAWEVARSER
jgi:hypothetical protein